MGDWTLPGHAGQLHARTWDNPTASYTALLCHGYGEHIGRYEHVAAALVASGAAVHGLDHVGHGRSDGERVLIADYEPVVDDFHLLADAVGWERPVVLIGHSMGGLIAARYAQRYGTELAALVLSGPVLGRWDAVTALLAAEEIPDVPIDPTALSRDPAVGTAYAADPLVWHGKFKRPLLEAILTCLDRINATGSLGDLPTLWLHGDADRIVPIDATREGIERIRGTRFESAVYPGAEHEIFNETNNAEVLADVTAFVSRVLAR